MNNMFRERSEILDIGDFEQALAECQARLARELGEEDVADSVWGYLWKLGLPIDVIRKADKESWQELVKEAKDYVKNVRGSSEGLTYQRNQGGHEELPEIAVKPSRNALRRAEGFAEVAAVLADNHPHVKRFRRRHLRSNLLTDEEARRFLDQRCGGPLPVRHGTKAVARMLWKLGEKLSKTYLWRNGDAVWFVLTGHAPPVRPMEVRVSITPPQNMAVGRIPGEYHPNTARIVITADAWINAKEVMREFRKVQRQILGGRDAAGPTPERTLEVVRFVARRMREYGEEDWIERWRTWKKTCPEAWRYESERNFERTFERFLERAVYPSYNLPDFKRPGMTPYQAYRGDWMKRRKVAG